MIVTIVEFGVSIYKILVGFALAFLVYLINSILQ